MSVTPLGAREKYIFCKLNTPQKGVAAATPAVPTPPPLHQPLDTTLFEPFENTDDVDVQWDIYNGNIIKVLYIICPLFKMPIPEWKPKW